MTATLIKTEVRKETSKRLFIGLALPEPIAQQVQELRSNHLNDIPAKVINTSNFHITLAFLGSVNKQQEEQIRLNLDFSSHTQVSIHTRHFDYFKQAQIIYLAIAQHPSLLSLHKHLHQQLKQCAIITESRQYRPHISLFKKAKQTHVFSVIPKKITWQAKEIHLYQSKTVNNKVEYHIIHTWLLSDGAS